MNPPFSRDVLTDPGTVVVVTRQADGQVLVLEGGWPTDLQPGEEPVIAAGGVVAVLADDRLAEALPGGFTDARSALLGRDDGHGLLGAVAFGQWRHRTRFCRSCADPLSPAMGGRSLRCPAGHQEFPRLEPAVIMRVVDQHDRILLATQHGWGRRFSVLAGFVDPGESLEDTVRREVMEEVGVTIGDVAYVKSQPWPFPSSLMLAFNAEAVTTELRLLDGEIAEAAWFTRPQLSTALAEGVLTMPTGLSVAHQLIHAWMTAPGPDAGPRRS